MQRILFALVIAAATVSSAYAVRPLSSSRGDTATEEIDAANKAFQARDFQGAVDHATKALDTHSLGKPNLATAYAIRAISLQNLKRCEEAMPDFGEAEKLMPGNADILINKGMCQQQLHQDAAAIETMGKVIETDPKPVYYAARCGMYYNMKKYSEALSDCLAALKDEPNNVGALVGAAAAYEQLGQKENAHTYWSKAHAADPSNAQATEGVARTGG